MTRRLAATLVAMVTLAGCGGGGAQTASTTQPVPETSVPSTAPATTIAPASTTPAQASSASKVPDARSVDVAPFLRPGTSKVAVVYGDMNGVPPEEIVVHSRSNQPGPNGLAASEFVDGFSWHPGKKSWVKVFDATTFQDLPNGGGTILEPGGGINQSVEGPFAMVDFAGDGMPELVFAVQSSGATAGPYSIWILSWLSEPFTREFTYSTERGGVLSLNPDKTLTLDSGEYGPDDPGCCPSQNARRTIGYDKAAKGIKILKTELMPNQVP